jgi:serpin B
MLLRREVLRGAILAAAGLGIGAMTSGCGDDAAGGGPGGSVVTADLARAPADEPALAGAVASVLAFTADLYRRAAAATAGNLVCSPYSVAVALGMARAGAVGATAAEMDTVLHASAAGGAPDAPHAGLNALAQHVEGLAGRRTRADGSTAEITLDVANSLWGQRLLRWEAPFLEILARHYGTGMRVVDYQADPAGAAGAINGWTSKRTRARIPELIQPGDLTVLTRLVLVNALYLRCPWETPFADARPAPFTRADGSVVQAHMMSVTVSDGGYVTGPGWRAVDIPYAGRELAMAVVVPGPGRFDAVQAALDGKALRDLLTGFRSVPVGLDLPRWTLRTHAPLGDLLAELGMPTAFTDAADFSGMTTTERLCIDQVVHEAFVAVDEEGTEAAAATAVIAQVVSATPVEAQLTVDRPFLFVIHDRQTAAPLFIGRVGDPTAG